MILYRLDQACNTVVGMWKFAPETSFQELAEVAEGWKFAWPKNYLQIYLRECSRKQRAIGILYRLPEDISPKMYVETVSDQLKRRFGNGYLGYDINPIVYILDESCTDPHMFIFDDGFGHQCHIGYNVGRKSFYATTYKKVDPTQHKFGLGEKIASFGVDTTNRRFLTVEALLDVLPHSFKANIPDHIEFALKALENQG